MLGALTAGKSNLKSSQWTQGNKSSQIIRECAQFQSSLDLSPVLHWLHHGTVFSPGVWTVRSETCYEPLFKNFIFIPKLKHHVPCKIGLEHNGFVNVKIEAEIKYLINVFHLLTSEWTAWIWVPRKRPSNESTIFIKSVEGVVSPVFVSLQNPCGNLTPAQWW